VPLITLIQLTHKKTLDSHKKKLEHWIQRKNTRSSGKILVVAPLSTGPNWIPWLLSTRYRALHEGFLAWHPWRNLATDSHAWLLFTLNAIAREVCFSESSYYFIRNDWAPPIPRVFSGVSRGLSQVENLVEILTFQTQDIIYKGSAWDLINSYMFHFHEVFKELFSKTNILVSWKFFHLILRW